MNASYFQYPPDLFALLVDAIPALCKSKKDVLLFFRGSGVSPTLMTDIENRLKQDRQSIGKHEIARTLLTRMNESGDALLGARRELLKRVTEFEDFSRCYESDMMKARGYVAEISRLINVRDSFTRMAQDRDREAEARKTDHQKKVDARRDRQTKIEIAKNGLFALFAESNAHTRGKALEPALNSLFRAYDILVAEDFKRKGGGSSGIAEQIDGVVEFDHQTYLVEMKWWDAKLGPGEVAPHINRLLLRSGVGGIFISSSEYTPSALETCRDFLQQRVLILCTLREIVNVLNSDTDLLEVFRQKIRAAKLDRNPYKEIA